MRLILTSGLTLFEVLISLLLFSLALLGLDAMLLSSWQFNRKAYFSALAEQQMHNLKERMRLQDGGEELAHSIAAWNQENHRILPSAEGGVEGAYPDYRLSLCWGDQQEESSCLKEEWRGSTLIELMLSLSLSLILLGLALSIYLAAEKQRTFLTTLNTVHDQTRFVLQRLESELRLAGFIGCPRLTEDFPLSNHTAYPFHAGNKLEIQMDVKGSSILTVRHRARSAVSLDQPMTQSSVLELSSPLSVRPGDLFLISDCRHADLFQVAAVSAHGRGQRLMTAQPLSYQYGENAEAAPFEITTYFVENTGRKDKYGRELSALYRSDPGGRRIELAEGIQKLKMELIPAGRGLALEVQAAKGDLQKTEYYFAALRN